MTQPDEAFSGPYVAIACFCERILQEQDGVMSLIRVIDRTTVAVTGPNIPDDLPPVVLEPTLVISMKAGFARGKMSVSICPTSPSGHAMPKVSTAVLFEGDDRGVNLVMQMKLQIKEEGLYWFDVLVEEQLLTRVPYRVLYQRMTHRAR